ncbi:hypothetical protein TNCV_4627921 [Trichonephila clavipes]|nr:hypothetical protein TNCV_4627921 [Trichonephila clavipes]
MRKESDRRSKITPRIVRRELREFVYHGCVFRGRDEYPVCGKSARSNSCSQKYYDRWCRTIFTMLLTAVCRPWREKLVGGKKRKTFRSSEKMTFLELGWGTETKFQWGFLSMLNLVVRTSCYSAVMDDAIA